MPEKLLLLPVRTPQQGTARRFFGGCRRLFLGAGILPAFWSSASERFPQPEFESGYSHPENIWPCPSAQWTDWTDVGLLAAALCLAIYLVLYRRSRRGIQILSLCCLAYFGLFRHGCVCSVGALQPVVQSLAGLPIVLPLTTVLMFFLPLLAALGFGRVFCAAVCPLGAVQDIVAVRPGKTSRWLNEVLSLGPYLVLGLTVLLAATGTAYLVCRSDPFVPIFRMAGPVHLFFVGGGLFLLGMVFARPYCRIFCPYGVLLRWLSMLSWKHASITPDTCIECRLCEESCPFDAIRAPAPQRSPETVQQGVRRLAWILLCAPAIIGLSAWLSSRMSPSLACLNGRTALLERLRAEETMKLPPTAETEAFRSGTITLAQLETEVSELRTGLRRGGYWLGAFLGLVFVLKLLRVSVRTGAAGYLPDRGSCLSCGRCYSACPREHVRLRERETKECRE